MRAVVIAGESSGDQLGAGLIEALRQRVPEMVFEGIAGPHMQAAGCRTLYPMDRLSVMGLFESFGRYPELIPLRRRLAREFIANPPDVFIGVDAPDFNLSLERMLKAAGIPTVHYVGPSVWAWRRYRLRKIAKAVDLMLTLFPFEAALYEAHGIPVRYVGHPLADAIPRASDRRGARAQLGVPEDCPVVALLPGSRMTEVDHLADVLVDTAVWLAAREPGLRFLVPLVDAGIRARFQRALARAGDGLPVTLVDGRAREVMSAADVVLLASGTATLEALLLKRPMVITYRTLPLTWAIGRRMLHVEHVGLPNLLAGRELVPELLQDAAVPERLGAAVLEFLRRPELRESIVAAYEDIHEELAQDANRCAAEAVLGRIGA